MRFMAQKTGTLDSAQAIVAIFSLLTEFLKKFSFFFLHFFYCCSSTVVSIFPPPPSPCPTHPHLPPLVLPPFSEVRFFALKTRELRHHTRARVRVSAPGNCDSAGPPEVGHQCPWGRNCSVSLCQLAGGQLCMLWAWGKYQQTVFQFPLRTFCLQMFLGYALLPSLCSETADRITRRVLSVSLLKCPVGGWGGLLQSFPEAARTLIHMKTEPQTRTRLIGTFAAIFVGSW